MNRDDDVGTQAKKKEKLDLSIFVLRFSRQVNSMSKNFPLKL